MVDVSTLTVPAHLLIPVAAIGDRSRVGFPAAVGLAYGAERAFEGREPDFRQAGTWASALFPKAEVFPF
jgi:hypothetical protein